MDSTLTTEPNCADDCEPGSVTVDQALVALLGGTSPVTGDEVVPLAAAVGRILAQPVVAPCPVPGHTNSAVDGYALRGTDLPGNGHTFRFRIVGSALAGKPFGEGVGPGEAIRIMTGAMLPEGSDTVIMQEHVEVTGDMVSVDDRHGTGQNVREAGEDIRQGETILHPGRWLTAADIGLLASIGCAQVQVRRIVQVGVLSTGSEVRGLGRTLTPGTVYDSNRYTLMSALRRMGLRVHDLGIVPDDPGELKLRLEEASQFTDAIVSSGGVSVGEADFIRPVLAEVGQIQFWRVAMKPGHPLSFGKIGNAAFFGLPGNPVAVLVSFYWLVRPALEKRMGISDRPLIPLLSAKAATRFRKKPGRMEFHRAILREDAAGEYRVAATGDQGSGVLRSMSLANCLVVLSHQRGPVDPEEWVTVLPLSAVV